MVTVKRPGVMKSGASVHLEIEAMPSDVEDVPPTDAGRGQQVEVADDVSCCVPDPARDRAAISRRLREVHEVVLTKPERSSDLGVEVKTLGENDRVIISRLARGKIGATSGLLVVGLQMFAVNGEMVQDQSKCTQLLADATGDVRLRVQLEPERSHGFYDVNAEGTDYACDVCEGRGAVRRFFREYWNLTCLVFGLIAGGIILVIVLQ